MVLLICRISQGGFSGERIVHVTQVDGTSFKTVVPTLYCRNEDGEELQDDDPPKGQQLSGRVQARLIANGGETATVEIPDGSIIKVPAGSVRKRELKEEYVPL
jgi:hypothetical protein